MGLKERIVKDTLVYSGANYIAMGLGIVISIATKAILGTVGAGYWALMKVVTSYGEYSDLGTKDAVSREIPQAAGAGDADRRSRLQDAVFSFALLMSVMAAVLVALFSLLFVHILLLFLVSK